MDTSRLFSDDPLSSYPGNPSDVGGSEWVTSMGNHSRRYGYRARLVMSLNMGKDSHPLSHRISVVSGRSGVDKETEIGRVGLTP